MVWTDLVRPTCRKRCIQFFLEQLNAPGQGRLDDAELGGRLGDAPLPDDFGEVAQRQEIHGGRGPQTCRMMMAGII